MVRKDRERDDKKDELRIEDDRRRRKKREREREQMNERKREEYLSLLTTLFSLSLFFSSRLVLSAGHASR
jgi:hypothetical protein